jgi:hypothetical protein
MTTRTTILSRLPAKIDPAKSNGSSPPGAESAVYA